MHCSQWYYSHSAVEYYAQNLMRGAYELKFGPPNPPPLPPLPQMPLYS